MNLMNWRRWTKNKSTFIKIEFSNYRIWIGKVSIIRRLWRKSKIFRMRGITLRLKFTLNKQKTSYLVKWRITMRPNWKRLRVVLAKINSKQIMPFLLENSRKIGSIQTKAYHRECLSQESTLKRYKWKDTQTQFKSNIIPVSQRPSSMKIIKKFVYRQCHPSSEWYNLILIWIYIEISMMTITFYWGGTSRFWLPLISHFFSCRVANFTGVSWG
jgi:hypothetical protein